MPLSTQALRRPPELGVGRSGCLEWGVGRAGCPEWGVGRGGCPEWGVGRGTARVGQQGTALDELGHGTGTALEGLVQGRGTGQGRPG